MRPNFPLQMAQRLAALFERHSGPLRIFSSCGFWFGSGWGSPLLEVTVFACVKQGLLISRCSTPCAENGSPYRKAKQQTCLPT
jgi:hypothetical protein